VQASSFHPTLSRLRRVALLLLLLTRLAASSSCGRIGASRALGQAPALLLFSRSVRFAHHQFCLLVFDLRAERGAGQSSLVPCRVAASGRAGLTLMSCTMSCTCSVLCVMID
jgi:hypothetical protein